MYGSRELAEASELALQVTTAGSRLSASKVVARNPATAARAALFVVRLPSIEVRISDALGEPIRQKLRRRTGGLPTGRLARAVLPLPTTEAEYLRGRHRQAVRTNVRRARAAESSWVPHAVP